MDTVAVGTTFAAIHLTGERSPGFYFVRVSDFHFEIPPHTVLLE